ncbi:MAG: hypothetical protein KKC84_02310 [Candidatus Omnitrophica bacterium]|nr:hypothetical protein [Candidatus Omnitrophota bacterium]
MKKSRGKRGKAFFALILAFACFSCVFAPAGLLQAQEALPQEKIISIAVQAVRDVKMSPDTMDIFYDEGNRKWDNFSANLIAMYKKNSISLPESCVLLEGRDFQAVYFTRQEESLEEGDIWIFVDRITGEVISNMFFG